MKCLLFLLVDLLEKILISGWELTSPKPFAMRAVRFHHRLNIPVADSAQKRDHFLHVRDHCCALTAAAYKVETCVVVFEYKLVHEERVDFRWEPEWGREDADLAECSLVLHSGVEAH